MKLHHESLMNQISSSIEPIKKGFGEKKKKGKAHTWFAIHVTKQTHANDLSFSSKCNAFIHNAILM